jgi:hypothetical protein
MTVSARPVALAVLAICLGALAAAVMAEEAGGTAPGEVAPPAKAPDRWAPFRGFLGVWEGTNRGSPGQGTLHREYRLILGDCFIEVRNRSVYPPQEKNPRGEVHEDLGYLSVDRPRKLFVLRQFHLEGFVNTYTAPATSAPPGPMVFNTEAIENLPPGWRARETYRFEGPDQLIELFELAEPGKEFTTYSEARLKRVP